MSILNSHLSRRRFLQVALLGSASGILAACGAPAAPATAPTAQPQATTAQAQPTSAPASNALSGKKGVMWGLKYDPHVEAYKRLATLFNKTSGVTLEVAPQDWPIEQKLIPALAAGTVPDVVCIMGKQLLPLHLQKALMPLRDTVYASAGVDPVKDFIGDGVGAYTWKNEIWGVPVEANQVGSMVNIPVEDAKAASVWDKYPPGNGQTFFDSYDSMWAMAKALQKTENGKVTKWGLTSQGWEHGSILSAIRTQGVKWWDNDAKKFNVDSEAGVQALKLIIEQPVKLGIETQMDQGSVDTALAGKVAISRGNPAPSLQAKSLGFTYELAAAPRMKPGEDPLFSGEGGWGFVAPKATKNPDVSIAFLKMLCTKDGQMEYAKIYDGLFATSFKALVGNYDINKFPGPDSANAKAQKLCQVLLPLTAFYGGVEGFGYVAEVDGALAQVGAEVRQGKLTAAEGATKIQGRLEAQYKQYLDDAKQYGGG